MFNRIILTITSSLILGFTLQYAQTPDTLWTKTYGGAENDAGLSVKQTPYDNGYIIAGYTRSFGGGGRDVYLIKTDENGNPDWTKTYGGTSWDCAHSVQQTFDGGYIVAGYRYELTGHADVWLLKTDSNGDTLWTRIYGGTANDQARSVQQTSDGGYIITGYIESFGAGARDVWLLKTEPDTLSLAENQIRNPQISFLGISPNPFEEKTSIRYQTINDNTDIKMQIYDITGRLVKTFFPPSTNSLVPTVVSWNGRNNAGDKLSSGVYFLTLEARNYAKTTKLLLIK